MEIITQTDHDQEVANRSQTFREIVDDLVTANVRGEPLGERARVWECLQKTLFRPNCADLERIYIGDIEFAMPRRRSL